MLANMLDEQKWIINRTNNDYNLCKYNGMLQAAYVLGYDVIVKDGIHTIIKRS